MEIRELVLIAVRKINDLSKDCNIELSDRLGMSELQLRQLHYLKIIDRFVDLTFGQFADILKLTKPSVTEIVNRLINVGCVRKIQSPIDRRIYFIQLTEKGRNIARVSHLTEQRLVDIILNRLSHTEIEALVSLIRKL